MNIKTTSIDGITIIEPSIFDDQRGYFMETYNQRAFAEVGVSQRFVQDNQSGSRQGTLRGMHYQICLPQGKLVRTFVGEIFDVVVDLRRHTATFGQWVGVRLSADGKQQLWVPPGFAHGFYVLSEWAEILYKTTDFYAPQCERTLLWNDPEVGIKWPLLEGRELLISEKDMEGCSFKDLEYFEE
jgi:dTDP-4-dehydrorhamnose 3,5-epimerase